MNTINDEVVGKNTVWSSEKVNKDFKTRYWYSIYRTANQGETYVKITLPTNNSGQTPDTVISLNGRGKDLYLIHLNSYFTYVNQAVSITTISEEYSTLSKDIKYDIDENILSVYIYIGTLRRFTFNPMNEWNTDDITIQEGDFSSEYTNAEFTASKEVLTKNPSVGAYSILQEGSKTLNTSGWYRIAQAKSGTHNLSRTAQARVMNIKLESTYWNNEDSSADINMLTSWQRVDFYANVSGKYPIVSGIRYVYDTNTDIAYIDIYYRGTNNNTVFYHFSDSLFEKVDFEPADSLPSTATVFKTADITQNYVPYIVSSSETRPLSADNLGQPARRALSVDLTSSSMTESKPGFDGYIMTFTWDRNTSIADNYRTQLAIGDETGNGLKLRSYNPVNKKWTEWNAFYPLKVVEKTILLGNLTWNKSSQGKYYATYNNTEAGISNARIIISCQIYDFSNLKATDTIEVNPKNNTVTQICAPTNTFASDAAIYVRWIYS